MKRLAILGASGHGKVVADTAEMCGWEKISFFDDAFSSLAVNGAWPISGTTEDLLKSLNEFDGVCVAIGQNRIRLSKLMLLREAGAKIISLIHPNASISKYAEIELGSVVCAGVVVNAYALIGFGCILNTGSCVDHDSVLGAAVHVSPNATIAGSVYVGDAAWIGIGSCVKQGLQIGSDSIVGAGAVVINNVPEKVTVLGIPALVR